MKFIDEVNITVASGNGGPGCVSFRRETKVPRGGPDGGDGGKGGDIVLKANSRLNSLLDLRFKKKYQAGNGLPGHGSKSSGQDGENLVLEVPPGTVVKDQFRRHAFPLQFAGKGQSKNAADIRQQGIFPRLSSLPRCALVYPKTGLERDAAARGRATE